MSRFKGFGQLLVVGCLVCETKEKYLIQKFGRINFNDRMYVPPNSLASFGPCWKTCFRAKPTVLLLIDLIIEDMALAAYRNLLRATRVAFHEDFNLLHAARTQARAGFDKQSSLDPSSEEATKAIVHADGVAQVLKHNVVQGSRAADEDVPLSKSNLSLTYAV